MKNGLLAAGLILLTSAANASTIDFETFGNDNMGGLDGLGAPLAPCGIHECLLAGNEFTTDGVTLNFLAPTDDVVRIIRVGGDSLDGFVPLDTPDPADAFGQFFMATDFDDNAHFSLTFDTSSTVSFDIADIDGGNKTGNLEYFTLTAFLTGGGTDAVTVDGFGNVTGNASFTDGVAGDAAVTHFMFSGVDKIEVLGTTTGGTRNVGFGLDNITFASVPEPSTLLLLAGGLFGLGAARRHEAKSS